MRVEVGLVLGTRAAMTPTGAAGAEPELRSARREAWRRLVADQPVVPSQVARGPRVGVRHAADRPWRFWLDGHPEVSAYRGAVGARRTEGGC